MLVWCRVSLFAIPGLREALKDFTKLYIYTSLHTHLQWVSMCVCLLQSFGSKQPSRRCLGRQLWAQSENKLGENRKPQTVSIVQRQVICKAQAVKVYQVSRNHIIKMKVRFCPFGMFGVTRGGFEDFDSSLI